MGARLRALANIKECVLTLASVAGWQTRDGAASQASPCSGFATAQGIVKQDVPILGPAFMEMWVAKTGISQVHTARCHEPFPASADVGMKRRLLLPRCRYLAWYPA
ncbi:MAG TPA: hypothetical protein VHX61_12470 [Rhizomicrobium sp.]|nr:hypothetical protein [Rhizomicrobium sp.]